MFGAFNTFGKLGAQPKPASTTPPSATDLTEDDGTTVLYADDGTTSLTED